jgi:hypothetical protein
LKDPDPCLVLMDPDPDPQLCQKQFNSQKTCR